MKVIAMLGDSHTWGEGVGADYAFIPSIVCSDLRMLPFEFPSYVNLIRNAFTLKTCSNAKEYYASTLTGMCERAQEQFGIIEQKALVFNENFLLCRLFFKANADKSFVNVSVDGKNVTKYELQSDDDCMNKCIRLINIRPETVAHKLEISSADGRPIYIHRVEFYSGEYAVVNCGVGSCTVERYQREFFNSYVAELQPYAVVFEGCTVNDWLSVKSLEAYDNDLERMIDSIKAINARLIMHTTFPVLGGSYCGSCADSYEDYVDTMRKTARKCGIDFADCHSEAMRLIAEVPENKQSTFMHHDKWHPNGTGHYLYARMILQHMK